MLKDSTATFYPVKGHSRLSRALVVPRINEMKFIRWLIYEGRKFFGRRNKYILADQLRGSPQCFYSRYRRIFFRCVFRRENVLLLYLVSKFFAHRMKNITRDCTVFSLTRVWYLYIFLFHSCKYFRIRLYFLSMRKHRARFVAVPLFSYVNHCTLLRVESIQIKRNNRGTRSKRAGIRRDASARK